MKQPIPVLVAFLLLTTSVVYAQPVKSGTYTGTPARTTRCQIVYSQLDDPSGLGFTDQAFEAMYAAYDSWGADDFIVDEASWNLAELFTPGSVTTTGAAPFFVNIAFYADAGGVPGGVICDFPANTEFTFDDGDISTDVSGCNIAEGTYWFSQQVRLDFTPYTEHFWATRRSARNNPGVWKNPGGGWGSVCLDWQPANDVCGMPGEDWLFELEQTCNGGGHEDGIPAIGPFGVVVLIVSLGAGSAYVLRRRHG